MLRVSFITSLKPILCTALTTQNATENNCIASTRTKPDCVPAQCICNWNTSVTGHKGQSAFPTANHCQGQLQTPQSLCVHVIPACLHAHADCSFVATNTCALCFAIFLYAYGANRSRNGVVNRLDDPGLESRTGQNIQIGSYAHQPPIQCVPGIKWRDLEADHSPPSIAEIKNEWKYTSTPPIVHGVCRPDFT